MDSKVVDALPRATVHVDDNDSSVDGYIILRSLQLIRVYERPYMNPECFDKHGFIVTIGMKGVRMKASAHDGAPIVHGQQYSSIIVSIEEIVSGTTSYHEARKILDEFVELLELTIHGERDKEVPDHYVRVCKIPHSDQRTHVVYRDRTYDFWACPDKNHDLLNDEDTVMIPVNPFRP